jgi:hypothetical protein
MGKSIDTLNKPLAILVCLPESLYFFSNISVAMMLVIRTNIPIVARKIMNSIKPEPAGSWLSALVSLLPMNTSNIKVSKIGNSTVTALARLKA